MLQIAIKLTQIHQIQQQKVRGFNPRGHRLKNRLCEYFKYNREDVSGFINVKDLIWKHKGWWNLPENNDPASYPKKFKDFIDGYLR